MLDTQRVRAWLDSTPDVYEPAQTPNNKTHHKRKAAQQEPSPPASDQDSNAMDGTTPKRRRLVDLNRTPRAVDFPPPASSTGSSMSWSESGDGASRSNSPKKQMLGLRLEERGLECRQLNIDTAPSVVAGLLDTIREIGSGIEILPYAQKSTILESSQVRSQNTRLWKFAFKEEGVLDSLPGRIPSPEDVSLVCDLARHCHDTSHEEIAWNMEVHHRLLQSILREPNNSTGTPFNFTTCTTARPHRRFVPYSSTAKMVDFCLYLKPTDSIALQALGRRTPTLTVNHTDFAPLQLSPIVLSIETKRPGKELDAAQLQMGVWHAAQWAFLRSVIGLTPQPLTAEEEVLRKDKANAALAELGFIPGIIVQGHRWLFVFSTLEGDKTVLWTERQFGTTQSILDTYAVVAGIRELARWARDVYVPWFQKSVLAGFQPDNEVG
ncbi:Ff.00g000910.m01.CDS01 [Fusarium sp. VM40]|nr:Ff.00g000910.m01.CDS01 [Fusarium sp. VM40]